MLLLMMMILAVTLKNVIKIDGHGHHLNAIGPNDYGSSLLCHSEKDNSVRKDMLLWKEETNDLNEETNDLSCHAMPYRAVPCRALQLRA